MMNILPKPEPKPLQKIIVLNETKSIILIHFNPSFLTQTCVVMSTQSLRKRPDYHIVLMINYKCLPPRP